ncbi:methyltransferase [Amycolatopsis sp. NPDC049688]|uniref:methyltransferase n=1 Tax=Amycolatopsis sp. NPDC049688 TaxID=3154733 RepID=UPI0034192998
MSTIDQAVDAPAVLRLSSAFATSRILHSAVELGVFEFLDGGPASGEEVRRELGLHPRLVRDFLESLRALGLLERGGEEYRNTAVTTAFLVAGRQGYLGGRIRTAATRHYPAWGRLSEALREGGLEHTAGPAVFERLYADPARARAFLEHMDANNALVAPQLAEHVDWSEFRSFVDLGGARGNIAAHLVTAHPQLHGGVFELPPVRPLFDELMAELGTESKVDFHPGDFFTDPLPSADVLILGHVLHDWSAGQRAEIVGRVHAALPPGGVMIVYDQMLDDEDPDLPSLIGSLNVALMTPGGSEYTVSEGRVLAEKAGFTVTRITRLPRGNDTVLVARKAR